MRDLGVRLRFDESFSKRDSERRSSLDESSFNSRAFPRSNLNESSFKKEAESSLAESPCKTAPETKLRQSEFSSRSHSGERPGSKKPSFKRDSMAGSCSDESLAKEDSGEKLTVDESFSKEASRTKTNHGESPKREETGISIIASPSSSRTSSTTPSFSSELILKLERVISEKVFISGTGSEPAAAKGDLILVYKSRFWVLGVFAYTAFLVMMFWGTFGPIMDSAQYAFQWDDWYISLLEGLGTLFSIICMVPFNWATQKYGLRFGMLLLLSILTFGTGIRCFTVNNKVFTYLASVGAIMSGMTACLSFSIPAMLSSIWFPSNERATATAVGSLSSQLGAAGMYIPPLFVRTTDDDPSLTRNDIKHDIWLLMCAHFGMAAIALVCTLIYFPEKPPTPPSVSSSVERIKYFEGIKSVVKNPQVMLVATSYVCSISIPLSWIAVINFSLDCLGINQGEALWIAIAACTISPIMAFIIARITDRLYGHLKISIIGLLLGSFCFFFWFLLITEGVIPPAKNQVLIAVVFAVSLQYSSVPLLIELAVELSYPCPESVVGALLSLLMDSVDTVFFLLLMIHSECYRWVSYILLGCTSVPVITMLFVKEVYKRSNYDH